MEVSKREAPPIPEERKTVKPANEKVIIVIFKSYKMSSSLSCKFNFPFSSVRFLGVCGTYLDGNN